MHRLKPYVCKLFFHYFTTRLDRSYNKRSFFLSFREKNAKNKFIFTPTFFQLRCALTKLERELQEKRRFYYLVVENSAGSNVYLFLVFAHFLPFKNHVKKDIFTVNKRDSRMNFTKIFSSSRRLFLYLCRGKMLVQIRMLHHDKFIE